MKSMNQLKSVYFLGIGGIGMSALARFFNHNQVKVAGYDRTPSALTKELEAEGIVIHYQDDDTKIPSCVDLCIYTPAVSVDLNEFKTIKNRAIPIKKRAEVLGIITDLGNTIAIAGTHGKTSTTSLTAHLFYHAQIPVNAFIGGIAANYNTNILLSENTDLFVVEADEFDRSFLTLHPKFAVITSIDADHLDIYGDKEHLAQSFVDFSNQVTDFLLVKESIQSNFHHQKCYTYSITSNTADYYANNIQLKNESYCFDLVTPTQTILGLELKIGGLHNVENAVAAAVLALQNGVSEAQLRNGLTSFKGVQRRFETIITSPKLIYIDDYAHHPAEIRACLTSLRKMYPERKITAVFQPHLFTRTRDFGDEFALALALADELILLDIYPARELPIDGIDSQWLLNKVKLEQKELVQKSNLAERLSALNPQLIVTMGAGDIDRLVSEIRIHFTQIYNL